MPCCIMPVKQLKILQKESPHLYNSKSLISFVDADNGEETLSGDVEEFRQIVKELEQYPYLKHYNAFILQRKFRKRK